MTYLCEICNKNYKTNSGFWKHNKKYHDNLQYNTNLVSPKNSPILPKIAQFCPKIAQFCPKNINVDNLICIYCNRKLSRKTHLVRHEKTCKYKINHDIKKNNLSELNALMPPLETLNLLKKEIEQLKLELNKTLIIQPNILNKINKQQNNTINNNNNTINIIPFGTEKLKNIISNKEMFHILNKHNLCINESIKLVHFNNKKPEYKNIFITNLKDKYAYIFDGDNFIIKEKEEILNELLDNHAYNIHEFVEKNRNELEEHTLKSMDRLFNFLYDKNNNGEYINFFAC